MYTEQYCCINELVMQLEKKQQQTTQPFIRTLLDPYQFPDGRSFFDHRDSQLRGITPVVIHNNWLAGT